MSSDEFPALSQDELRRRLYQTFKSRGVLDSLKTQLRNQLIHDLMNPILSGKIQPQAVSSECSSLLIGASNSLVADHLRRCGYEYSLSVFYPESGLEKDKALTMQDLLQLIRINPKTDLYKALISASEKENTKGFLVQILTELLDHSLHKQICNTETQTSPTPGKESLAEKLQLIDEQFADMYPQCHKSESFEVKLAEYRKEVEQQLQEEMSQKLQHFKEVEIAKIKMDERAQSQKEISELRKEFEKVHRAKSEALSSRERNAIERLQKQQEIDAREIYLQRQSLLKDIETVRSREAELKQRIEAFELAQNLQESKNKTVEDALRHREVTVKNIEETYDQKLKNELLKYQLELNEEYIARTKKITEDEKKMKDKAMLLHEETISLNSKKQEFEHAISHSKELELEIDSVKAQVLLLSKQNQLMTKKLEEVSDYPTLKEEKMELQVQNKLLKQQLEEARNENLELRDKLSRPSAEYLVLEAELKRAKHARKLEGEESDTHKQLLEKQLQNEIEHCVQLKTQLSECENTIRKLNAQMEDLKLQLKQTQTALENEVYRNPKPSLVDRSVIDLFGDKTVPPDIYIDGAFLKTQPMADFIGMGNGTSPRHHHHVLKSNTSQDSDLEFVANTKARIKELEREAEYLEEAYRNYQYRAIQTTAGPAKTTFSSPMASNFNMASRQRLWFAQDDLYSQEVPFHCQKNKSYRWTPGNGDHLKDHLTPPRKKSTSRRLSSTPVSKAKRNISNKLFSEDTVASSFAAPHQNADQPLSPIQRTGNLSSPDHASNISVSSSPASCKQKLSLQQQQGETQGVSDSAKSERLLYKDLGNDDSELGNDESASKYQEDIPEQLESDVSHPSHIVSGSHVPATVPAAGTSQQDISGAEVTALEKQKHPEEQEEEEEEEEQEEQKWEEREGKRQQERQDTLEREQGELEKANEELCMQEAVETEKKHEDVADLKTIISKSEEHGGDAITNPLEKYMKIIQQNREQEFANEDFKKEAEVLSEKLSGSGKEDSFSAAATLHGEPDDDFW
uniref:OFD1 centriole and centriolar satellite protein n=1 Tax=Podarcis muralis TaxID=64176 RepID=A0A670II49_PODMU|nr:oral-facial-digital syndrome 1 protein isoform X1 [Podarcis muralis]XP_028583501.1 oral-facial-digital syndrome 1 protein isoform X1 [Podarcis muralis]XP_028583502.1 oral-facial-digital syndrome 1 protein isoform X1 [Podarcis muralis]XP_028583503.1 oral-facial-digital syndrome 1 protein isoform X1 [Podarcis muralis]XP_028583504.1 oral-facial-digital syndrome 1 protein isoform X1 [Podarcis muralis]